MNAKDLIDRDRLLELLAQEASAGITIDEAAERDELLAAYPDVDRDELFDVAAVTQLAFLKREQSDRFDLPESLKARIIEHGRATVSAAARDDHNVVSITSGKSAGKAPSTDRNRNTAASYLGWATAAALAVALIYDGLIMTGGDAPDDLQAAIAQIRSAPGTIESTWQTPDADGFEQVTGQVIWNNDLQRGYMIFAGMPPNRPDQSQYQLWIVDPSRDAKPVDGGVFDIPQGSGERVVPINAKLVIDDPQAFAITEEKPGGVVVSEGPLLVVAPVII